MSLRRSLGFVSKSVLVINVVAIGLLLLSYLAPIIKPQTFWPIAFMGIAYPIFLGINLLFVLFWIFRKPSFALLSLVAILIGWKSLNKNFGFNTNKAAIERSDSTTVRIMSYNVQMFNHPTITVVSNQREIFRLIGEVSPDVLCIQEFYTRS